MNFLRRRDNVILPAVGIILVILLWDAVVRLGLVNQLLAASPVEVFEAFLEQARDGTLASDFYATLVSFVTGVGLAVAVGVPLGLASGWYRVVEYVLSPFIWLFYNLPKVAFYPLFIIAVGLGRPTITLLCFLFALFPLYDSAYTAVKQADQLHIMAGRAFGAGDRHIFGKIVLPAAAPSLAGGLRLGMGHGLIGVIVGELFGADVGLGFRMNFAASTLDVANYFASLALVIVIGVTSSEVLRWAEARISRWRS